MGAYIPLKTGADVTRMRVPGRLLAALFRELAPVMAPGLRTREIEAFCTAHIEQGQAEAWQHATGFPATACVSVNNVAVHGVPDERVLEDGDIVTVDVSVRMNGWASDAAWTYVVGSGDADAHRLLRAAWQTTNAGIAACRAGRRLGDVAAVIEHTAARFGCQVVREFTGHGIGRRLHEAPSVPNTGSPGTGEPIVPGMVLTVEPVISLGSGAVRKLADGWAYVSADGALTAQFEHTVSVHSRHTEVLTYPGSPGGDVPPY
ncbi:MAG: type I methionyl aminopeptidase [Spirochaetaceae bacterium]